MSLGCSGDVEKIRIVLATLVTVVWLAGYVISYARGSSQPTELSGLMAIVLGWALSGQVKDVIRDAIKRRVEVEDDDAA